MHTVASHQANCLVASRGDQKSSFPQVTPSLSAWLCDCGAVGGRRLVRFVVVVTSLRGQQDAIVVLPTWVIKRAQLWPFVDLDPVSSTIAMAHGGHSAQGWLTVASVLPRRWCPCVRVRLTPQVGYSTRKQHFLAGVVVCFTGVRVRLMVGVVMVVLSRGGRGVGDGHRGTNGGGRERNCNC